MFYGSVSQYPGKHFPPAITRSFFILTRCLENNLFPSLVTQASFTHLTPLISLHVICLLPSDQSDIFKKCIYLEDDPSAFPIQYTQNIIVCSAVLWETYTLLYRITFQMQFPVNSAEDTRLITWLMLI